MVLSDRFISSGSVLVGALLLFFTMTSVGVAQDKNKGFYLGVGAGQADQKDTCDDAFESCDDTDLGWKVFGGYKFNQYFGLETGAVDFGESEFDTPILNLDTLTIVPGALRAKVDGFFLTSLVEWPVNDKFSVLAKLGMIYWDVEFSITDTADNLELIGDEYKNGTDIFFG